MASDYIKIGNEELIFNMNNTTENLIIILNNTGSWCQGQSLSLFSYPIPSFLKHKAVLVLLLREIIFAHEINEFFNHFPLPKGVKMQHIMW